MILKLILPLPVPQDGIVFASSMASLQVRWLRFCYYRRPLTKRCHLTECHDLQDVQSRKGSWHVHLQGMNANTLELVQLEAPRGSSSNSNSGDPTKILHLGQSKRNLMTRSFTNIHDAPTSHNNTWQHPIPISSHPLGPTWSSGLTVRRSGPSVAGWGLWCLIVRS